MALGSHTEVLLLHKKSGQLLTQEANLMEGVEESPDWSSPVIVLLNTGFLYFTNGPTPDCVHKYE